MYAYNFSTELLIYYYVVACFLLSLVGYCIWCFLQCASSEDETINKVQGQAYKSKAIGANAYPCVKIIYFFFESCFGHKCLPSKIVTEMLLLSNEWDVLTLYFSLSFLIILNYNGNLLLPSLSQCLRGCFICLSIFSRPD